MLARLRSGTFAPADGNKFLISALQSFILFLVGSFLSIFLDRFSRIEQSIATTAAKLLSELPVLVGDETGRASAKLGAEITELRENLADGMVRTGAYVYRTLRYDEFTGILYSGYPLH